MNVADFFDPYNVNHLKAFKYLNERGCWPDKFIPESVSFTPTWIYDLTVKMAKAWLTAAENDQVLGMHSWNQ
jgi:hypothetical protein